MMCVMPWPATAASRSSRLVTSPWMNWTRDISSSLRRARRRWDSASRSNTHGLSLRSTRFLTIQAPMNPFAPVIRNRAPVALAGVARVMLAHYMFWGRTVNATGKKAPGSRARQHKASAAASTRRVNCPNRTACEFRRSQVWRKFTFQNEIMSWLPKVDRGKPRTDSPPVKLAGRLPRAARTLAECDDPVRLDVLPVFFRPVGPMHQDALDLRSLAEAEMHADVVRAEVT